MKAVNNDIKQQMQHIEQKKCFHIMKTPFTLGAELFLTCQLVDLASSYYQMKHIWQNLKLNMVVQQYEYKPF